MKIIIKVIAICLFINILFAQIQRIETDKINIKINNKMFKKIIK